MTGPKIEIYEISNSVVGQHYGYRKCASFFWKPLGISRGIPRVTEFEAKISLWEHPKKGLFFKSRKKLFPRLDNFETFQANKPQKNAKKGNIFSLFFKK